jgi:hypothetical protein
MNRYPTSIAMLLLTTVAAALVGCGDSPTKQSVSSQGAVTAGPPATVEVAHDHAHPTEGPHGGSLIELGSEEYHAELVHDDAAETVTIYLLDSAAKELVPIEATELKVNLSHEGQAEQFALIASPQKSDTAGKSSRFVSTSAEVCEELCHEHAEGQLVVAINGKQYRGDFQHDHEGHDHADHEHEGHDHGDDEAP